MKFNVGCACTRPLKDENSHCFIPCFGNYPSRWFATNFFSFFFSPHVILSFLPLFLPFFLPSMLACLLPPLPPSFLLTPLYTFLLPLPFLGLASILP